MIEIKWNPSAREQRQFVFLWLPAFFAVVGAIIYWRFADLTIPSAIWGVGLVLTAIAGIVPGLRRPLYVVWMCAVFPIGWTVSHLILVTVYYVVITPIGLLLRMFGHDPLDRDFERSATTYWVRRDAQRESSDYFRQY